MEKKTPITHESLIEMGMQQLKDDPFVAYEKDLSDPEQNKEDLEEGAMKLVIAHNFEINGYAPALILPYGAGTLWLSVDSIEKLKAIESSIASYEPNW